MINYKHLTLEERYTIEQLTKAETSVSEIAEILGRNPATIYRELRRNKGGKSYRHKRANEKALYRRYCSSKHVKFTAEVREQVDEYLRDECSPEQITGIMRKEGKATVSHERIYQYVYEDQRQGGTLYRHLRWGRKKRRKRMAKKDRRGQIPNRVSIDERPDSVDSKRFYGDWEGDLIMGKNHKSALLSLVERKGKYTLLYPLSSKNSEEVGHAMLNAMWPFRKKIRSITVDNGKEFASHEMVSRYLNTQVYFAHPYSSWERGLNENTNGLVRQYFPKGTDFNEVDYSQIMEVQDKLNRRPRKTMNYSRPNEFYPKLIS